MNTTPLPRRGLLSRIGFLRALLGTLVLCVAPLSWFSGHEPTGWYVIPVYIAPVFAILLLWLLMLDLIMSRVHMSEPAVEGGISYSLVVRLDLVLLAILVLSWAPFLYRLVA